MTELLFSYGTLCQRAVQVATFGRELEGTVFRISTTALAADASEVDACQRVRVPLRSGDHAWVYVFAGQAPAQGDGKHCGL